jgi:superfamily II DNA or RNA helicase
VSIIKNCGSTYHEVYSNYVVNNIERTLLGVNACKNFVNSGKSVLFLVKRLEHANIISELLDSYKIENIILNGSNSSDERNSAIQDIKSGKIKVVIASSIFDQGIDIPNLDVLINMGGGKSTGRMLQRVGRVIRSNKGKDKAFVLDFYDQCKYLRKHSDIRMKIVKSEPKFEVKRIK